MIRLIFDCIRAPYDWANILQAVIAAGECEIHVTGNSLRHDHRKVTGKVASWSKLIRDEGLPQLSIKYWSDLEKCLSDFKAKNIKCVGTSPRAENNFFDLRFKENETALVFGNESTGLSEAKMKLLDTRVKIPMSTGLDFMTLSVVVPIVVYEAKRQINT